MNMFQLASIRARLLIMVSLFGICLLGMSLFAVNRLHYIAGNFTEYHAIAVNSDMHILKINRDMNYVSRLTRSIMLGDDYAANMKKLDQRIADIYSFFEIIRASAAGMQDQQQAERLIQSLDKALADTRAFLEDGRTRMQALEKVERTAEVLHTTWQGYHAAATPLAEKARESFRVVTGMVEQMMKDNHSETTHAISGSSTTLMLTAGTVLVIGFVLAFALMRSITRPLNQLRMAIEGIEQDSDLRRRVNLHSNDELGATAAAVDKMLEKFHRIIQQVISATREVNQATARVASITSDTTNGVRRQQAEIEQVATAMNEMSATVQEVAKHAVNASTAANTADKETQQGGQVVQSTIASINDLAGEVERATNVIHRLGEDSENIGKILDVIRGVAEQTNLLALNAAIEAARAGEQGRGFAVVADEVRTLASRTQNSTKEIHDMIGRLQQGSREAVEVMEVGRDRARSSVECAGDAGKSLQLISDAVMAITDMNTQIASAAEEQSAVAEDINRKVVNINGIADQSVDAIMQVADATQKLSMLSNELQAMVQQFRA
jgi:methyl-accepting chemotaxis protein